MTNDGRITDEERIEFVVAKVRTFLAVQKPGDVEWPEVTQEEMNDVVQLFCDILDAKFERDCDNDQVINFQIYDRRDSFPLPYTNVRKVDENTSVKDALTSISDAVGIAEQYNGYASQMARILKYFLELKEKNNG